MRGEEVGTSMSVHGEYQRALRVVQLRLAESEFLMGEGWAERLECAQLDEGRDLSSAARASLELLASLDARLQSEDALAEGEVASRSPHGRLELLRDACHRLRAHCHAILGSSAANT
jgi:hypothetical protein